MDTEKRTFKLPAVEDYLDYKRLTHLGIFAVYIAYISVDAWVSSLSDDLMNTAYIVQSLTFFVFLFLFRKVLLHNIRAFGAHLKKYIPFVLVGAVCLFIMMTLGSTLTSLILGDAALSNQDSMVSAAARIPFFVVFVMVIVAPILEELMFRRSIRVIVNNRLLYYILSPLLFAMPHIIIGFTFPTSFAQVFTYLFGGLCLAFIYEKSNNIWCSIFVHFLNNTLAAIVIVASL